MHPFLITQKFLFQKKLPKTPEKIPQIKFRKKTLKNLSFTFIIYDIPLFGTYSLLQKKSE